MSLMDKLKGRKNLRLHEEDGLRLALATLETFKERNFGVTGVGLKAHGVDSEEVIRFVQEELPDYYKYATIVTTYSNKHDFPQAQIEIRGTLGVSGKRSRYNPFDIRCVIKTEDGKTEKT